MKKETPSASGCETFLSRYSEFRDGEAAGPMQDWMVTHLASCEHCQRYDRVVSQGVAVLRDLPDPFKSGDGSLHRRVTGRVVRDDAPLGPSGSGFAAAAAVLVAVLLGAVAWSPVLFNGGTPEVELAPILAGTPTPNRGFLSAPGGLPYEPVSDDLADLSRPLLFEYSPLRAGRQQGLMGPELE